jgi:hypothetical protein
MVDRRCRLGLRGQGALIHAPFEHGRNTFIGTGTDREGPPAGRFESLSAGAFAQAHEASTRPEALLGMRAGLENRCDHVRRGWPTGGGPTDERLWGPLGIVPVRCGHMTRHGTMAAFVP